jgi:hypothetical protein
MEGQRPWHRLFGLTWMDFFTGLPNQLRQEEHNALLHLFSTRGELMVYGSRHYRMHSADTSTMLLELFRSFQQEIDAMSNALKEFAREALDELLKELPAEKRLEGLSAEKRLEGLSAEQILRAIPIEKLLQSLSPEQRVQGLSAEELFELAKKRRGNGASANP